MAETVAAADAVELAVLERSGFVESRHIGVMVVLAPDGEVRERFGDTEAPVLARSSLKPMQALAMLTAGAPLAGDQLAIATASHTGTDAHAALAAGVLQAAGLDEGALQCPESMPSDAATRAAMIRAGHRPGRLRMNCSGKHAAMLATCVHNGWDLQSYLDPAHPLQTHIRELVERLAGQKVAATAIDGCGAPVHAVSLEGLAHGVQRIATASDRSPFALHRHAAALATAVRASPWVIAGPGQADSVLCERFGVFSKYGAEGVIVMVAPDGTTVAGKTLDGSLRVGHLAALTLLERAGAVAEGAVTDSADALGTTVSGGGRPVGTLRATLGA